MATVDFPSRWPQLLPALSAALAICRLPDGLEAGSKADGLEPGRNFSKACAAPSLEQCLIAVAAIAKQFVYFRVEADSSEGGSGGERKGSPEDLDAFSRELAVPLAVHTMPLLAANASAPRSRVCAYLIAKTLHRCTRAYLPQPISAALAGKPMPRALLTLLADALSSAAADGRGDLDDQRLGKRVLQLLLGLQERHTVEGHVCELLAVLWPALER